MYMYIRLNKKIKLFYRLNCNCFLCLHARRFNKILHIFILNPWKNVISLVELKESNYKGTKDVNRMRQVMINRKSDFDKKNN